MNCVHSTTLSTTTNLLIQHHLDKFTSLAGLAGEKHIGGKEKRKRSDAGGDILLIAADAANTANTATPGVEHVANKTTFGIKLKKCAKRFNEPNEV